MLYLKLCTLLITVLVDPIRCRKFDLPKSDSENGKYEFSYFVKDDFGNDYSHNARSDGDIVTGEYRTLMPDARVQIVHYRSDSKNGYTAHVTYIGASKTLSTEPIRKTTAPTNSFTRTNSNSQDCKKGEHCNSASTISKIKIPINGYSAPVKTNDLLKIATPRRSSLKMTSKLPYPKLQTPFVDHVASAAIAGSQSCTAKHGGIHCNKFTLFGTSKRTFPTASTNTNGGYKYLPPSKEFIQILEKI